MCVCVCVCVCVCAWRIAVNIRCTCMHPAHVATEWWEAGSLHSPTNGLSRIKLHHVPTTTNLDFFCWGLFHGRLKIKKAVSWCKEIYNFPIGGATQHDFHSRKHSGFQSLYRISKKIKGVGHPKYKDPTRYTATPL